MAPVLKVSACSTGAVVLGDFKTNTKQVDIKNRGEVEEVTHVRDVLLKDGEFYGTYLYINFLHRCTTSHNHYTY